MQHTNIYMLLFYRDVLQTQVSVLHYSLITSIHLIHCKSGIWISGKMVKSHQFDALSYEFADF